jgi:hypothetical protein
VPAIAELRQVLRGRDIGAPLRYTYKRASCSNATQNRSRTGGQGDNSQFLLRGIVHAFAKRIADPAALPMLSNLD